MALVVSIEATDRTSSVVFNSLRKTDNLNQQIDHLEFKVRKYGALTYVPAIGDEVIVTRDGTRLFGGVIVRVYEQVVAAKILEYTVQCADYGQFLKRELVTERYENTTVTAIIADLVANYTTDGFTTTNVFGGQAIESISFNRLTVADCLQKLADAISHVWYVDYSKDIHFFPKNTEAGPTLTDTSENYIYDSLEIVEDLTQVRNSVLVQGGEAESDNTRTEYLSGDGTRAQFPLANKFASKPTITVGGTPQTVGTEYLDDDASFDVMWNFNEKYVRFTAGNTPASGTNNVEVTGIYLFPIVVRVPAPASIAEYGRYEFSITDKSIKSQDEAIDRAVAELTSYQNALHEGSFRTYDDGFRSGQVIRINSTQRGKDIDVLIQSVTARMRDPEGTTLEYEVRFATLKSIGIIEYLQSQLRSKEVIVDDQETLLNFLQAEDEVDAADSLATPTTTSPPYRYGSRYFSYYHKKITIDHTLVAADLTDFPVYVDLADLGSEFFSHVKADGSDIRVTKSDGYTLLPREVVSLDAVAETGELHFKADALSSSVDTEFYIYYGYADAVEPAADSEYGSQAVWSGNGRSSYENLVSNPSFEVDLTGWQQYVNGGTAGSPTLTRDTSDYVLGIASLKHVGSVGTQNFSGTRYQLNGLINGHNYRVTLFTKGTTGDNFNLYVGVGANPQINVTQTGIWQKVQLDFTADVTSAFMYCRTSTDEATFFIDNVLVYDLADSPLSHEAVYHFEESSLDSSENGKNGTLNDMAYAAGKLGIGIYQSASNGDMTTDSGTFSDQTIPRSITCWTSKTLDAVSGKQIWRLGDDAGIEAYRLFIEQNTGYPFVWMVSREGTGTLMIKPAVNVADGALHKITVTYNEGGTIDMHIDGTKFTGVTARVPRQCTRLYLADRPIDGSAVAIDEYRVAIGERSDSVEAAEYRNQSSPATFYSVAAEGEGHAYNVAKWGYSTWS